MFDVERNTKPKPSLSKFGGVFDNTSNVYAHDDLLNVRDVIEGKFHIDLVFSHVGDSTEISFETSCVEKENCEGCIYDSKFYFYADKSCND